MIQALVLTTDYGCKPCTCDVVVPDDDVLLERRATDPKVRNESLTPSCSDNRSTPDRPVSEKKGYNIGTRLLILACKESVQEAHGVKAPSRIVHRST
jgi:hypothetical protein